MILSVKKKLMGEFHIDFHYGHPIIVHTKSGYINATKLIARLMPFYQKKTFYDWKRDKKDLIVLMREQYHNGPTYTPSKSESVIYNNGHYKYSKGKWVLMMSFKELRGVKGIYIHPSLKESLFCYFAPGYGEWLSADRAVGGAIGGTVGGAIGGTVGEVVDNRGGFM